jgi:hypothetical protein
VLGCRSGDTGLRGLSRGDHAVSRIQATGQGDRHHERVDRCGTAVQGGEGDVPVQVPGHGRSCRDQAGPCQCQGCGHERGHGREQPRDHGRDQGQGSLQIGGRPTGQTELTTVRRLALSTHRDHVIARLGTAASRSSSRPVTRPALRAALVPPANSSRTTTTISRRCSRPRAVVAPSPVLRSPRRRSQRRTSTTAQRSGNRPPPAPARRPPAARARCS